MQQNLDSAVNIINGFIKQTNRENEVSTPSCHNVIIKRKGRKGHYRINDWTMLRDGIHGTYETRNLWAKALKAAMDLNAQADADQAMSSPKRSWLNERNVKRQRTF